MAHKPEFRLLFVVKGLGVGGAERWLLLATRWLTSRGIEIFIANIDPRRQELRAQLLEAGATVKDFRVFGLLGLVALAQLFKRVADTEIDVVHGHLPMGGVISRLIGLIRRIPVIYTEHNLVVRYHWLTGQLNRITYGINSEVIAVSESVRRSIADAYGENWVCPVSVLLNPVSMLDEPRRMANNVRAEVGLAEEDVVIGTVASFRPVKRLDMLLRVFARLHRAKPTTRLLLVGDGPETERLRGLAKELSIESAVSFTGFQSDPLRFTAVIDVFVLCSDWEGLPLALLEAMGAARAVVATRVGGVPEVVEDGVNGRLTAPGDEGALFDAILELTDSPVERARLGAAAQSSVIVRHDLDNVMGQYLAIYRRNLRS